MDQLRGTLELEGRKASRITRVKLLCMIHLLVAAIDSSTCCKFLDAFCLLYTISKVNETVDQNK